VLTERKTSAIDRQGQNLNQKLSGNPGSLFDFWINPDLDPDVCRIALKMLWIHYLVASVISPSVVKTGW